ncbi:hypothetical protein [Neobacillus sp. Marseille-QA0830]
MIFHTEDPRLKKMVVLLERNLFYEAVHVLVDIITEVRDREALLSYMSAFAYNFSNAKQDNYVPNRKRKESAKEPRLYSAMSAKFAPPFDHLLELVKDTEFREVLHPVVRSITLYCENDMAGAVKEMEKAIQAGGRYELLDYYMAVYFSALKDYRQFMKYYDLLAPENRKQGFSKKYVRYRPDFIHDPAHMIYELNKEMEKQRQRNEDMVKRYAHNWSNLLLPHTIQRVVNSLVEVGQFSNEAMILRRAYQNETLLGQQSVMLQLRHSDDFHQVQLHVRKGIAAAKDKEAGTIQQVIRDSLEIVLFKIFFSDERTRSKRDQRILDEFQKQGVDIGPITEQLGKLLMDEKGDLLGFVSKELVPIETLVAGPWPLVRLLKEEGGAYALLIEIFTELFRNAFTYASKSKGDAISVSLEGTNINGTPFLALSLRNKKPDYPVSSGTEEGLDSMKSLLEMVNRDVNKEFATSFMETENRKHDYEIQLMLKANLLIARGELRKYGGL